jgi:hypothetical protein
MTDDKWQIGPRMDAKPGAQPQITADKINREWIRLRKAFLLRPAEPDYGGQGGATGYELTRSVEIVGLSRLRGQRRFS